jgi:hypothetical protein
VSHPIINELVGNAQQLAAARSTVDELLVRQTELLTEGVALRVPSHLLADAAGVSAARVSQVAPRPVLAPTFTDTAAERETASEKSPADSCVLQSVDALIGADTLSGRYSARREAPYGRRVTIWVDLNRREMMAEVGPHTEPIKGDTLADVLFAAKWHMATRVFLVGPPPSAEGEYGDAGIRSWFLSDPGEGWRVAPVGHHLADARTPTARYEFVDGLVVEVMRTAAWWGEDDATAGDSRHAWFALQDKLREAFGDSTRLLSTPAVTGRDLWQRTIGPKTTYPVLSDEIRELLHSTAGQGRIELVQPPSEHAKINGVHVRDGRLMYSALTWGMPIGPPTLHTREMIDRLAAGELQKAVMGRSRWHVRATVPQTWDRSFGLLMAPREGGQGWRYPAGRGETFETWCDGSELWLAMSQGWDVEMLGAITWREGKPLNTWTDKLLAIWQWFEGHPFERLCRRAIRSLILFAVGAFASRGRTSTYALPEAEAAKVPNGARPSRAGGMLVWTEAAPATGWAEQLAHPEWSATIWARARVRLLDGPGIKGEGRTGALHLPPGVDVLGFRTDALVLTGDPGWGDDGKAGRLRYDGDLPGVEPWPATEAELLRLKTAAQNRGRG